MVNVALATAGDMYHVAYKMRTEDVEEVWGLGRCSGLEALLKCYHASAECWTVVFNGDICCIFGCIADSEGAVLWMVFTNDVQYLPLSFFKQSKKVLGSVLDRYGRIHNYTQQGNVFILKWLKWLKFNIEPLSYIGIDNIPVHRYWKERC